MPESTIDTNELVAAIENAAGEILTAVATLSEDHFNAVPYEGSWTAAQLLLHLTKSTAGLARAMRAPVPPAERPADERVEEFRKVFLDYSIRLQSPEMLVPETGVQPKAATVANFQKAYDDFNATVATADLDGLITGLPFGDATKMELLHFALFHTQRHLHQLQKICNALDNN